jgi:hypothetical protein
VADYDARMVRLAPEGDRIQVGERFAVAFQRTLRVPEDGRVYPLPPGLGRLPIRAVEALSGTVPVELRRRGGFIVPLHRREALWIAFAAAAWKPNAVQVAVGGINVVSGGRWEERLASDPQNYVVCPGQPWLDGIHAGAGHIRQFVALPLGLGRTVEGQLRGREETGGIQIRVYEPKPGIFPDRPPEPGETAEDRRPARGMMGLGAGGKIAQRIHPDPHGLQVWDPESATSVLVHLVSSADFRALAGEPPPPSPVSAETYTRHGFPWFDYYDEERGDLPPPDALAGLAGTAKAGEAEPQVSIDPRQVRPIRPGPPRR